MKWAGGLRALSEKILEDSGDESSKACSVRSLRKIIRVNTTVAASVNLATTPF
jgi:hypothetical protein